VKRILPELGIADFESLHEIGADERSCPIKSAQGIFLRVSCLRERELIVNRRAVSGFRGRIRLAHGGHLLAVLHHQRQHLLRPAIEVVVRDGQQRGIGANCAGPAFDARSTRRS